MTALQSFKAISIWPMIAGLAWTLSACSSKPPAPSWQMNAKGAADRAVQAYFQGDQRVEQAEFARARAELARTGDAAHMARLELLRCAAQVASLNLEPCTSFLPLAPDATESERAYAKYLAGNATHDDVALLPAAQQGAARATPEQVAAVLTKQPDPLANLVAAGVVFARGQASPAVVALAVETASQQGWSRPLLAWLGVQLKLAEHGGAPEDIARIQRRIQLITHGRGE